jgi:hypothetical protein
VSKVSKGNAELKFILSDDQELIDFKPLEVLNGYSFQVALTVDDLNFLEKL